MARQDGILPIVGTIGKLTFFKTQDGHMVREKGGVAAGRIATDAAFQRTRENNAEFSRAGKAARVFRNAFRLPVQKAGDTRVVSRLVKIFMQVIHEDAVNPRGLRNVIDGEALLLEGFECNISGKLTTSCYAPYTLAFDRATGTVTLNIPPFVPAQMVAAPAGATHFKISLNAGVIDFEKETYTTEMAETGELSWDNNATAEIPLAVSLPPASASPAFILLSVEFLQEINTVRYALKNGAYNACAVIKVDAA